MIVLELNNDEQYILRFVPYLYPNENEMVRVIISNPFGDEIVIDDSLIPQVVGNGYLSVALPSLNIENDLKYKINIKLDNEKEDIIFTDEIIFTMKNKYDFKYNKSDNNFLKL